LDEWKRVFDVNVNGIFYCNRFVARLMRARGYGRIVNIASIAGNVGNPMASDYSASKAAVIGLTKSLGKRTRQGRRHCQRRHAGDDRGADT
jgi:NAD(P)-dependent dehydrogenase (short-subunit alcohol dehydrogenase family)